MPIFRDLSGQRFGRLVVLRRASNRGARTVWRCRCDCGKETNVCDTFKLTSGHTASCRCLNRDKLRRQSTTHGKTGTREYRAWASMKQRCYKPSQVAYPRYGGRGITVYGEWRTNFPAFLAHLGPCPEGYTLDRIDSNGHYAPGNVRWASYKTQGSNTSRNRYLEHAGKRMHISDWGQTLGCRGITIHMRLLRGWPIERALTEPVRRHRSA